MTPKIRALMLGLAMLAANDPFHTYERRHIVTEEVPDLCFRPECNNKRAGNKLYCSAQCNKLDKKRRKNLK